MDCISCGLPSGYNRVLVEEGTRTEAGGLCVECEQRRFGDRLSRGGRDGTDGCRLCSEDAHVYVPEWDPQMDVLSDGTTVWEDYRVTDRTPALCVEHFQGLAEPEPESGASLRTPPQL